MAPPQPEEKASELIERFNHLVSQPNVTQFELLRMEGEVKKLLTVDAVHAYLLLGMLGCLKKDESMMRENHERALKLAPNSFVVICNYATSLSKYFYFSEAQEYYKRALEITPNEATVVKSLIDCLYIGGRFHEARHYLDLHESTIKESGGRNNVIREADELLEEIQDDELAEIQKVVSDIVRERGYYSALPVISLVDDEGETSVDYDLSVNAGYEEIADANMQLIEKMIERFDDYHTDSLVFRISYSDFQQEQNITYLT